MIEPNRSGAALGQAVFRQTFDETARWYDAIYAARGKDYVAESTAVLDLLADRGVRRGPLADIGCGTGEHVRHFTTRFDVVGFDPSRAMLEVARQKVPQGRFVRSTAESLPTGDAEFAAITMLFSAIGYLPSLDAARLAVRGFLRALRPGGVLVIEPALFRGEVEPPQEQRDQFLIEGDTVDRRTTATLHEDRLEIEFEYQSSRGRQVELHPVQLWTREQYLALTDHAAVESSLEPTEPFARPLLVAQRSR